MYLIRSLFYTTKRVKELISMASNNFVKIVENNNNPQVSQLNEKEDDNFVNEINDKRILDDNNKKVIRRGRREKTTKNNLKHTKIIPIMQNLVNDQNNNMDEQNSTDLKKIDAISKLLLMNNQLNDIK